MTYNMVFVDFCFSTKVKQRGSKAMDALDYTLDIAILFVVKPQRPCLYNGVQLGFLGFLLFSTNALKIM